MPEHFPWDNWALSYDRDLAEMVLAEKLGFDEYWIGEHHSGWYENVSVPEYMIAKASAMTSRIQLATGVVNLPYHDPFQVAERLAFLDNLTHGRLIFGAGGLPTDWALHDIEGEEMRPRMVESLGIIKELTESREPYTYEGQFWSGNERSIQVAPYKDRVPEMAVAGLTGTELRGRRPERLGRAQRSLLAAPLQRQPELRRPRRAGGGDRRRLARGGNRPDRGAPPLAPGPRGPRRRRRGDRDARDPGRRQTVLRLPDRAWPRAADEARRDDGERRPDARVDGRERVLAGRLAGRSRGDGEAPLRGPRRLRHARPQLPRLGHH
jgi:alkanesulfonate monooxygenase SsuD/methylene tetrahydromethanopterin reductase-like flavin-dependent oxidoreductase (luciferase family)